MGEVGYKTKMESGSEWVKGTHSEEKKSHLKTNNMKWLWRRRKNENHKAISFGKISSNKGRKFSFSQSIQQMKNKERKKISFFCYCWLFFRSSSHGKKLLILSLCLSVHLSLKVPITRIKDQLRFCVKIKIPYT